MKVLFLDMDGVLVTWQSMKLFQNGSGAGVWDTDAESGIRSMPCDPKCVGNLNTITEETGAKIVISSSWRCFGLEYMKAYLARQGVLGEVIDVTGPEGTLETWDRGSAIRNWLRGRLDVEGFVVLDDMHPMHFERGSVERHHVWTSMDGGLAGPHVDQALEILNRKEKQAA